MWGWFKALLRLLCFLSLFCCTVRAEVSLVNDEVKRTVDLSTHLAKISTEVLLSNQGGSAAHSFVVALEADLAPHLAYIGVSVSTLKPLGPSGGAGPQSARPKANCSC